MRTELARFEGTLIEVVARIKTPVKAHHNGNSDLSTTLLTNVRLNTILPNPDRQKDQRLVLDHLWVLRAQLRNAGFANSELRQGVIINFIGRVYSYHRKGGRSRDRGLYGYMDYGILPIRANR